jgi:dual specificity tyrosine-phosphorylation-regulated kinase 2/3/4
VSQFVPEFFPFVSNDHIAYRFCQESVLGKGSFGSVIQCYDHKNGNRVAIKMLRDKPMVHSQLMFELGVLRYLQKPEDAAAHGIIQWVDSLSFRGFLCIVMELLSQDIHTVLKGQRFVGLQMSTVHVVAREVAATLDFMHSRGVVHCDIKPANILFTDNTRQHVKVIDYGCACYIGKKQFSYIQSRFYRAPEVVLGLEYGPEIDIWSLACVLCEMVSGRPLFRAASEQELVSLIVQLRGLPPLYLLRASPRAHLYFDETGQLKRDGDLAGPAVVPGSLSLKNAIQTTDPGFLDLIDGCLMWAPTQRLTARKFLSHPWIKQAILDSVASSFSAR